MVVVEFIEGEGLVIVCWIEEGEGLTRADDGAGLAVDMWHEALTR